MIKNSIKVCLTPALFDLYSDRKSIVIVVDILRATSAMCIAVEKGVKKIIPVSTVEEALDFKGKDNHILAAERNGKIVPGFDFGNSPLRYLKEDINGKNLVVTTTNGTKAINIAKRDHNVVIGSFLNIKALTEYLYNLNKDIIILCAGWKNDFCTEDTLFAGALIEQLKETNNFQCSSDSCSMASLIYNTAKEDMFAFLENSQHRRRLAHLNIINDVSYCLKRDQTNVIPIVVDNQIEAYK
jgi:2-phosphosulfolactate phosphatase